MDGIFLVSYPAKTFAVRLNWNLNGLPLQLESKIEYKQVKHYRPPSVPAYISVSG